MSGTLRISPQHSPQPRSQPQSPDHLPIPGLLIATDETVTRPSPDHSPNPPTASPDSKERHLSIQTAALETFTLFENEDDERASCCCRPCRRCWNASTTDRIVTAVNTLAIDQLLENQVFLGQVKANPKAILFALERPLNKTARKKLRAVRFILAKPEIANDPNVITALQKITKSVFGSSEKRTTLRQKKSFYEVETEFLSDQGVTNEIFVTKAVIHGYDLLRAFAPQDKVDALQRQFVYRVVYTLDQYLSKPIFKSVFGNKTQEDIVLFLRETMTRENLNSSALIKCIEKSDDDAPFADLRAGKDYALPILREQIKSPTSKINSPL